MFGNCRTAGRAWGHHGRHQGAAGYGYGGGYRRPKYNIPVNIIENDTDFEIHIFAVGFDKENIKVSVTDNVLYVSGTRTIPEDYQPNFRRQEYPIKSFERTFELSDAIDSSNIGARQENGVLILTLPIRPEAQASVHTVEVQ